MPTPTPVRPTYRSPFPEARLGASAQVGYALSLESDSKGSTMCIICTEFQKERLTIPEARRNLGEMVATLESEHVEEIEEIARKTMPVTIVKLEKIRLSRMKENEK